MTITTIAEQSATIDLVLRPKTQVYAKITWL